MLELKPVPRTNHVDQSFFELNYLGPRKPVVLTLLAASWPALQRWTPDFLGKNYEDRVVKVYDASYVSSGSSYMSSLEDMRFPHFLQKVLHESVDLRMFLYSLPAGMPELQKDVIIPKIARGFSRRFVFLFFGCRGSVTPMHYDIDMSHVFHTAIYGRKRIVLFAPEESRRLYQLPFTVRSPVDVDKPDYQRFPLLAEAKGWEVILEPGETLFIPAGYWHHVYYEEGGYAISMRCVNERLLERIQGWLNLGVVYPIDRLMNKLVPKAWAAWKERISGGGMATNLDRLAP